MRLGRIADPLNPGRTRRDPDQRERYEPDPETADILADLYRRYIRGQTMTSLVAMLAAEGILNLHGRPWSSQALTLALDSGFGAGLLRVHSAECRCGKPQTCKRSDYLPGAHTAVITPDEWDAYRERRGIVASASAGTLGSVYALSGLVRCGQCRASMVAHSQPGRRAYTYRCTRWRDYRDCPGSWPRRAVLEEAVQVALARWAAELEEPGHATQVRRRTRQAAEDATKQAAAELAAADKALTRLAVRAATDEHMPEEVYEAARAQLLDDRATAMAALERASAATVEPQEEYAPLINELLAEWDLMPAEYRRTLLARLVRHVTSYRVGHRLPARIVVTPMWEECSASCCALHKTPSGVLDAAP